MVTVKKTLFGKRVSESIVLDEPMPFTFEGCAFSDLFFGSVLLEKVQEIARRVAQNHSEQLLRLKSIDFARFYSPLSRDDRLFCHASCNRSWSHLLEVGVMVKAQNIRTLEVRKIFSAYFLLSSEVGDKIIPVRPETKEELRRYLAAEKRRKIRQGIFKNSLSI